MHIYYIGTTWLLLVIYFTQLQQEGVEMVVIFPTALRAYHSVIYPQGSTSKTMAAWGGGGGGVGFPDLCSDIGHITTMPGGHRSCYTYQSQLVGLK